MKDLLTQWERTAATWFLLPLLVIFFLLRLPSLIEPYWYGDEGIYETIGSALNHGRILYSGIWDNKPPLLYLTYALFHADQFAVRAASLLVGLATVIVFFLLAKKLFTKRLHIYLSTATFAFLFATPMTEGNIANAENFMLLPILLAACIISSYLQYSKFNIQNSKLVAAGLLLGIAFLYKIVAMFDFVAFALFLVFLWAPVDTKLRHLFRIQWILAALRTLVVFILSFLLPLIIAVIYFVLVGAGKDFYKSVFSSNVGYVGYGNAFIIPQGFLILKLLILAAIVLFLFFRRLQLPKAVIFIALWFSFALFDSFFSQRNYTHYFLMSVPSLSLAIILPFLLTEQRQRFITGGIIALLAIFSLSYFTNIRLFHLPAYYQNYLQYVTNHKSVERYQAFFDSSTPRDYMVADYIRLHTKPGDSVFLWGNSAQVYVLSQTLPPGRYTVAYHISGVATAEEETGRDLKRVKPKYIFVFANTPSFPFPLPQYRYIASLGYTEIYEKFD